MNRLFSPLFIIKAKHKYVITRAHTKGPLMNRHNGLAISDERRELLDQFQFLNVNYSVFQRRGDNELAPGNSDDTSFNECRGNA